MLESIIEAGTSTNFRYNDQIYVDLWLHILRNKHSREYYNPQYDQGNCPGEYRDTSSYLRKIVGHIDPQSG